MFKSDLSKQNEEKRGIAALLILIVIVFLLFLYVRWGNTNTLTIGIFYGSSWDVPGSEYYDILEEAIREFQKDNPGMKVTYVKGIPADDYSEWLSDMILKGEEPDIYFVLNEDFNDLVSVGALKPLDILMQKDMDFDEHNFYQSAFKAGTQGDKQYALPFESNPMMMFVNKTLLKNSGIREPSKDWDWEKFYKICSSVTRDLNKDGTMDQFGVYDYQWIDAVVTNGLLPFNDEGTQVNILDGRFIEAVEFVKKLEAVNQNHEIISEDFDLGNVAFRPLTFAEYRTYMPYPWRIKKYSSFEWNCIPMPAGPSGNSVSSMKTLMIGISSRTQNEKKAWEFAKLLTTDEKIQSLIYEHTAGVSPLKSVTTSKKTMELLNRDTPGESDIDMTLLDSVMESAISINYFENYSEIFNALDGYLNDYIKSNDDTSIRLYNIKNEIQKMLE